MAAVRYGMLRQLMTLNVTVAARWLIVQSSDFRLTRSDTGQPISDTAQKQIVLHYSGWSALVCYTGVAQWQGHDTAAWLERLLTHEPGDRTPRQVLALIVREAQGWLSKVPVKQRRHSFTVAMYERAIPHIYVLSTFERPGGATLSTAADELMVTHLRPRGPRCVVTGQAQAITEAQRSLLESELAYVPAPERMRLAVALASRDAANRAGGTVSEGCVVAHLLPDGSGEAQVFGNMSAGFLPAMILRGQNVASFTPAAMDQAGVTGPSRLVGVTWTGNGPMSAMVGAYRELSRQTRDGWPP